jgi:quercetin dioxygenase-like cupin family protein
MSEFVFVPATNAENGVVCKISSVQTDHAFTVLELVLPAGVAVPWHVHQREDELLYVMEGECRIQHDGQTYLATVGATVVLPKGQPHAFDNPAAVPNRLQITAIPGGLDHYFEELKALGAQASQAQVDALNQRYAIQFLSPQE